MDGPKLIFKSVSTGLHESGQRSGTIVMSNFLVSPCSEVSCWIVRGFDSDSIPSYSPSFAPTLSFPSSLSLSPLDENLSPRRIFSSFSSSSSSSSFERTPLVELLLYDWPNYSDLLGASGRKCDSSIRSNIFGIRVSVEMLQAAKYFSFSDKLFELWSTEIVIGWIKLSQVWNS